MQAELIAGETALDWATGEVLAVHPAAAVFPLLPEEDLDALAADIAEHGLRDPIVRATDGVLIDGRNRLRACVRAQVAPHYTRLPPDADPAAYVLSKNIHRRHLTAGQRAMAVVVVNFSTVEKRGQVALAEEAQVGAGRVGEAAIVHRYAIEYVADVLSGATPLNVAYTTAHDRKAAESSATTQLAILQEEAPDLAVLVQEDRISLKAALLDLKQREDTLRADRKAATLGCLAVLSFLGSGGQPATDRAARILSLQDPVLWVGRDPLSVAVVQDCIDVLEALRDGLVEEPNGQAT